MTPALNQPRRPCACRQGMAPEVVEYLQGCGARRIVYVSCNASTQARDAKLLCGEGRYVLRSLQPVDLFPHTPHIETVAVLEAV